MQTMSWVYQTKFGRVTEVRETTRKRMEETRGDEDDGAHRDSQNTAAEAVNGEASHGRPSGVGAVLHGENGGGG